MTVLRWQQLSYLARRLSTSPNLSLATSSEHSQWANFGCVVRVRGVTCHLETIYQIQAAIACHRLDFPQLSKIKNSTRNYNKKSEEEKNYKKLLNCDWLDFVFNLFGDDKYGKGDGSQIELPLGKVFNQNCTGNQKSVWKIKITVSYHDVF